MKNISRIDSNFKVQTNINKDDIKFYYINQPPFEIHGVFYDNGKYRRMPERIAKTVNGGVLALHTNTAGGRVRFKTDSSYIAIYAKMENIGKMPHFALTGSAGFDIYVGDKHSGTFIPPFDIENGYESIIEFESSKIRDITINFPLYSDVLGIYIGVSDGASVYKPEPYKIQKPIVFYGSSITQGGCASRPGNSYQSNISRRLDCDYINLGFSGSAKAEDEIAEYISNLKMSAFVYDYDHNAPTIDHLAQTHEKMFKKIRAKNPDLPIIMMPRPKYQLSKDEELRYDIIESTYVSAKENGDKNVYLIDNEILMRFAGNDGTVDGCHPNDLGFNSMAIAVGYLLEKIFS